MNISKEDYLRMKKKYLMLKLSIKRGGTKKLEYLVED